MQLLFQHLFARNAWILCAVTALIPSTLANAKPTHPLLGHWEWHRTEWNCKERYHYATNGKITIVSGAEQALARYSVSPAPDKNGFYTLHGKTLSSNQAKDCTASPPPLQFKPYTVYLKFDAQRASHMVCAKPSLERCFGPLKRVVLGNDRT
jgi:hypothetical protein